MNPTSNQTASWSQSRAARAIALNLRDADPRDRLQEEVDRHPAASTEMSQGASLDSLQQQLEGLVSLANGEPNVQQKFVELTGQTTNAIWCGLFRAAAPEPLSCVAEHNGIAKNNLGVARSSLLPATEQALATGTAQVSQSGKLTVVAVPVFVRQADESSANECLSLALNLQGQAVEPFLLIAQTISANLSRRYEREQTQQLGWQIDSTAAIAELTSEMSTAKTLKQASLIATNQLAKFLGARQVAFGVTSKPSSKRTKVTSISGATEVDRGGSSVARLQAAMNETLVRDSVTTLPAVADDDRSMKLANQKLLDSYPDSVLVASPLTTSQGETIGAWVCLLPDRGTDHCQATQFARGVSTFLADAMDLSQRASAGPVTRLVQQTRQFVQGRTGILTIIGAVLLAAVMAIPVPHRVSCQATLQPTQRRFAVAPHDGVLLESTVKPGDLVTAGQVVAVMDDRELRMELSELYARRESAIKQRDVHRSSRDAAATRISECEIEQLDAQIDLVRFRQQNLEIRSAIDGIVLQGDLDDARGAPVRTGDVLMEIGPLDSFKLEIDVPEAAVRFVEPGQLASVVLEGNPFEAIDGTVTVVRPMSEIRDNQNVFVGELPISNDGRNLRPGMQGHVKIEEGYRPLGWLLFHRPFERLHSVFY